jgi:hypothetical protein|tara:strand:- start:1139 stop:1312 length:174 start_codon:yes stop_codon:yes gene_type:complete
MVVSIDDAIDAVTNLQFMEARPENQLHHESMLVTLEFLQGCGFVNLSLEDSHEVDSN